VRRANSAPRAVTAGTITDELKHQFEITLDKRKIHLEHPIRALGEQDVELRLHPEVITTLNDRELRVGIEWAIAEPWVDERTRSLLCEASVALDPALHGERQ